jgi:cupin superfamily acireductone dioxygenase involved in methionine salvage
VERQLTDDERRNIFLIKREFIKELDHGLGQIKKSISRAYSGLLTNIPANVFYYIYFHGTVRSHVIEQIRISLRMAIEYDGHDLDTLIEKYKADYLANDLISIHCRHDHPRFQELQEITINNMYSRVPILNTLIHSHGNTYSELVKDAFHSEEEVRRVLEVQMIFIDRWIDILKENPDIIDPPKILEIELPIRTEVIFKIIMDAYDYGLQRLDKKMEGFFPRMEAAEGA